MESGADSHIVLPLCFIIFFSVLNGVMFNVAVPSVKEEFHLLPSVVSWVVTGYIVVFALGSMLYGKLADSFAVRDLITLGLVLFNVGSMIGLLSHNYAMLLVGRLTQAAGASSIPALAMITATRYFPASRKGAVLGAIASTVALSSAVGPIIGGFIAGAFHWRYIFLPTLCTLLMVPVLRRMLPADRPEVKPFDLTGALLLGATATLVLMFVTRVQWLLLAISIVMLALFVLRTKHAASPFIDPALFRNAPYRNTVLTTFLCTGTFFGTIFMVPIMLRDLHGLDATHIGLIMSPGALSAVVMGTIGGRLSDRIGARSTVFAGMAMLFAGYLILSTVCGMRPLVISISLVACFSGFSFLQPSFPHAVSSELPRHQLGIGMGIYNLFFFLSGGFSGALIGRLLDFHRVGFHINPLIANSEAWLYSNIFIMLAGSIVIASAIFFHTFSRASALER